MPYSVTYTDQTINTPILVADKTIDTSTSLTFVGRNYAGYGQHISNDLLHLLENFAGPTAPGSQFGKHPVKGQLWFDSIAGQLKVNNDGTNENWSPVGSVYKDVAEPSSHALGEIWVDTLNTQLKIFDGNSWVLVGPEYSQGELSGVKIEPIIDTTNVSRNILSFYTSNKRVITISDTAFTPKQKILGFSTIQQGITLVNSDSDANPGQTQTAHRFYGTATNSERLGGVSNDTFLRTDQNGTMGSGLFLAAGTIKVGSDNNLIISKVSGNYRMQSLTNDSAIEIMLKDSLSLVKQVVIFTASGNVGINKANPTQILDVGGSITASGSLIITGTTDSSSSLVGSIRTTGGMGIAKQLTVGTNIKIETGTLTIDKFETGTTTPAGGAVILPGTATHDYSGSGYIEQTAPTYDIGSATHRFRNIYVETFQGDVVGTLTGNVIGNVVGDITGSAVKLKTARNISITGDASAAAVSFDGSGNVVLNTTITSDFIDNKVEVTTSINSDTLLIHREYVASALGYIANSVLHISSMVHGSISSNLPIYVQIAGVKTLKGTISTAGINDTIWNISNLSSSYTFGTAANPEIISFGIPTLHKTTKATFLSTVPIGSTILYPDNASPSVPAGYILCNNQSVSKLTYNDLYNVLGVTTSINATNFRIPNLSSAGPTGFKYYIYSGI